MKKLFAFVAAALFSVATFATPAVIPSDADLASYATKTYTMCIYNESACNDIVLTGTYSSWSSSVENLQTFEPVCGFEGWYVVSWDDESGAAEKDGGVQAKPVHLDGIGKFSWDYQLGPDAELIRGGSTDPNKPTMNPNGNEVDIKNLQPGILVIDVKSWKNDPCALVYHVYNITLVSPDCNPEDYVVPAISGDFNNWAQQAMTMNELKTAERQQANLPGAVFEYNVKAAEGSNFKFRSAAEWGKDWTNLLKEYDEENDEWKAFDGAGVVVSEYGNLVLGEETNLIFDLGDPEKYSWDFCGWSCIITMIATNGSISGPFEALRGSSVTLTAIPNTGYHFAQWSDGITDNPRTFKLTQDTTFTAEFAKNKYTIKTEANFAERGTTSGDTVAMYLDTVGLAASSNYGYHFTQWNSIGTTPENGISVSEATSIALQLSGGESSAEKYTVIGYVVGQYYSYNNSYYLADSPNGNRKFVVFRAHRNANNGDKIAVTGNLLNYYGTPEVAEGCELQYISHFVSYSNPCSVIVTGNDTYQAVFEKNKYNIVTYATNGRIQAPSQVDYLDEVTLSAIPDYGYHFTRWSDGATENPRTITITQDTTFTAEFDVNTSGQCGDNLVWVLVDSTLSIAGSGDMWNEQPWVASHKQIAIIALPQGLTSIGNYAFSDCSALKEIAIPQTVKSIGVRSFFDCSKVVAITIPNPETTIGDEAFAGITDLHQLIAPAAILHSSVWFDKLESVVINGGKLLNIDFVVLADSRNSLKSLDISSTSNTTLPYYALRNLFSLRELELPSSLETISYMSVAECKNLKGITIPASVVEIEQSAFEDCRSLATLTFAQDSKLTKIDSWAFYNAHALQKIELPALVEEIGDGAFYGCTYLNNVSLPASVRSIGDNAFALCSKLQRMDVDAIEPPLVEDKTFFEVSTEAPIYVPEESVDSYKAHSVWGKLNIVGKSNIPQGTDEITHDQLSITKILRNGQIFILRGEKAYTMTGQEVR